MPDIPDVPIEQNEQNGFAEKTARLLEYAQIMGRVASRAMSEEAAAGIAAETPCYDGAAVEQTKEAVAALLARVASGDTEPRASLPSIGFLLPKLGVEGMNLEIDEAFALGVFVERGAELLKWIAPAAPPPPALAALLDAVPDCAPAAAAIFRVLDKEGKMRDLPGLRAIRQRMRNLAAELETAVSRYAAGDESRRMLQSALPSQRDGRTVLAVKANFRSRIKGIVHEVSSSGQTVFVEPEDVVEKNNELLIEQRNLDAEMRRIMRELTASISQYAQPLRAFHQSLLRIETLRAKARYSFDTNGIFAKNINSIGSAAEKTAAGEPVVLKQARHPLVAHAVPIDLEMGGAVRTLIITGPNTGGKTVALKTVGLFALLNQTGLALPCAAGTALPVFDGVYADIGDEQSIGQSLSTFSAHIANIAGIVSRSTEHSLVLLDELGSGTDPQEGSAIAMAVLDCLIERGTRLIVTTHHGILKNYGYTRQGVENASVEFDSHTLSPTYRIVMGVPGESRALDIAGRNGLPAGIVAKARSYLDNGRSDVSALIGGLKEKHRELDEAARKTRTEEALLREERRRADLTKLTLRQKELELKSGAAGKLGSLLSESRKTLENLVRELREGEISRDKTLKVKAFLGELARSVDAENAAIAQEEQAVAAERSRLEAAARSAPASGGFAPGMEVLAGKHRRRGTILRLDKKGSGGNIWLVETGSLKMRFPESELSPAAPPPARHGSAGAAGWAADLAVSGGGFSMELNLRGMRLEEAVEALRRQVDAAVLSGAKEFSVVHGTGGGVLQKGVHDYLRGESAVADYYFSRPELGGFGRTEVVLR